MCLKGNLGFKGERGYSAYEIAVQNGFEGSEQDWLDTIGVPISTTLDENSTNGTVPGSKSVYDFVNERIIDNNIEIPIILPNHSYTQDDVTRIQNIVSGTITPTDEDYYILDLNGDGKISLGDAVTINKIINGTLIIPEDRIIGKIIIKNDGLASTISFVNLLTNATENSVKIFRNGTIRTVNNTATSTSELTISSGQILKTTEYSNGTAGFHIGEDGFGFSRTKTSGAAQVSMVQLSTSDKIDDEFEDIRGIIMDGTDSNGNYGKIHISPYAIEISNGTKKTTITATGLTTEDL